ncbi:MAG: type II secretion system protein [Candidatus Brocadiia bacterium]
MRSGNQTNPAPESQRCSADTARGGFTLIEILVVVAIIGMLAGMILAASHQVRERAKRDNTYMLLQRTETALEEYRDLYGSWPTAGGSGLIPNETVARILMEADTGGKAEGTTGAAIQEDSGGDPQVVDPWENPIRILKGGFNRPDLDIWSLGPNGTDDTPPNHNPTSENPKNVGDDIVNWVRRGGGGN